MATNTTIEWADKTWSPIIGCERLSAGCDQCYAINTAHIRSYNPNPKIATAFAGTTKRTSEGLDWTGKLNLLEDRLAQPLTWKKPARVFVNSMSDLFHDQIAQSWIADIFAVMAAARRHTFQLLTKRHARMRSLLNDPAWVDQVRGRALGQGLPADAWQWPLPNLWLGVSVENQQWADIRIPALLNTPAAVRFLSCEPLLGPVDLKQAARTMGSERGHGLTASYVHAGGCCERQLHGIGWVIVGGESGRNARPMHPDWARSIRDQCTTAGVPFFFKQYGEYAPTGYLVIGGTTKGTLLIGDPVDDLGHRFELARVGKKAAGRELDGREWNELPA
ncbi:phage Gp37/Gp68 family protein [Streptomyces violascens]|uniref:phage Gp37/Gp68 family protein n=1 Tax=Streptomyces violascens TaxID=67381 RepID=UPI0037A8FD05